MIKELNVPLINIVLSISDAIGLISPTINKHHKRVTIIALNLAEKMNLSEKQIQTLAFAGLLHDIGAFSLKEWAELQKFEFNRPYQHAKVGYLLLKQFKPFTRVARVVRYHHTLEKNAGQKKIPVESQILHLADRIAILINDKDDILDQTESISKAINKVANKVFFKKVVKVFNELCRQESFWFDSVSDQLKSVILHKCDTENMILSQKEILNLSEVFCQLIDFKSPFTATHSKVIGVCAEVLTRLFGFPENECQSMKVAGYLHDIGKLAVPVEILEKPAKLTRAEFNIIKRHTYHTYYTLSPISIIHPINEWGAFHHECLDGEGYPFHVKKEGLSLFSRIMAVIDHFVAIAEDRPYRKRMSSEEVIKILSRKAKAGKIDSKVVSVLLKHYKEIDIIRSNAQKEAQKQYSEFRKMLKKQSE